MAVEYFKVSSVHPMLKCVTQNSHLPYLTSIAENKFTIGCEKDSSLHVNNSLISKEHCTIVKQDDKWLLESHSPKTWLNGVCLMPCKKVDLCNGDEIKLGCEDFIFQFSLEDEYYQDSVDNVEIDTISGPSTESLNDHDSEQLSNMPVSITNSYELSKKETEFLSSNKTKYKRSVKEITTSNRNSRNKVSVLLNQGTRFKIRQRLSANKNHDFKKKYSQLLASYRKFRKLRKRDNLELIQCRDAVQDKQAIIELLCKRLCEYSAAYDKDRKKTDKQIAKEVYAKFSTLREEVVKSKHELEVERSKNCDAYLTSKLQSIVRSLSKELECPICTEIMVEPAVTGCKHTFCSSCIIIWLDKKKTCAFCKATVTRMTQSLALEQFIENFIKNMLPDERNGRQELRFQREKVRDHPKWNQWFDKSSMTGFFPFSTTSTMQRAYSLFDNIFVGGIPASSAVPRNNRSRRRGARNARRQENPTE